MASGKSPTILTDSKSLKVIADWENKKIYVSPGLFIIAGKYAFFEGGSINIGYNSCRIGFKVSADFFTEKTLTPKKEDKIRELFTGLDLAELEKEGWTIDLEKGIATKPDDGKLEACPKDGGDGRTECSKIPLKVFSLKEPSSLSYELVVKPISSNVLEDGVFFKPIATIIMDDKNKKVLQHFYGPLVFSPIKATDYKMDYNIFKCFSDLVDLKKPILK